MRSDDVGGNSRHGVVLQMQNLGEIIRAHITLHGPMSIETYWNLCLSHPEHGYYIKKDPLGVAGDFTTSPEISQLFGEMIGIWAVNKWQEMGCPSAINLVECGPGRGTLMADLLRIAAMIPDFDAALQVHLVEMSPFLRQKQREALGEKNVIWHNDLSSVPSDDPLLIIGNEFLDALPIRQYVFVDGVWRERVITTIGEELGFSIGSKIESADFPAAQQNDIFEASLVRDRVFLTMCQKIKLSKGSILMIDYGHDQVSMGNSFQAVMNHQFSNVLENQGHADLTSHIDFARLKFISEHERLLSSIWSQNSFLIEMGIVQRAAQLRASATLPQQEEIDAALFRLLDIGQMGDLFKVIEVNT
ncbi:MAG: SAM-dependent methyltransferase [Alphaproteobacteria bacterium]|nr:SAM-dependent methyltransferase [Alphaproteobacteria bacterium]MCB9984431.1 SAM-dependent methyltransferase [Micavibrio sp.]HRK97804.1 SAM-dependent methyltransferase [Alphaproteobacteria bacterium]